MWLVVKVPINEMKHIHLPHLPIRLILEFCRKWHIKQTKKKSPCLTNVERCEMNGLWLDYISKWKNTTWCYESIATFWWQDQNLESVGPSCLLSTTHSSTGEMLCFLESSLSNGHLGPMPRCVQWMDLPHFIYVPMKSWVHKEHQVHFL